MAYNRYSRTKTYEKPQNKVIAEAHMGAKVESLPDACIVPILTNAGTPVSLKNAHLAVVQGLFVNYAEKLESKAIEPLNSIVLRGSKQWTKQGKIIKKGEKGTFMLVPRSKKNGDIFFQLVAFFTEWQVEPINSDAPGTEIALGEDDGDASIAE